MSRAINIDATRSEVIAMCEKLHTPISVIERLHPAGTRVVLHNAHDAGIVAQAYDGKLMTGVVTRIPIRSR